MISIARKLGRHKREVSRDVAGAALSRMRLAGRIGRALEGAARMGDDAEGLAVADMILEAARPENIFTADDMHNADGEAFSGYGSLTHCASRLDPAYMKAASARAARRTRAALEGYRPQAGEHLRLITLTMPDWGLDFAPALEVLDSALVLFKKRAWFKRTVRGAVIGIEFTLGADGDRWHVHAHILAWSKWVVWRELGERWTGCLNDVARSLGVTPSSRGRASGSPGHVAATSHGRAVVDVRLVTSKRGGRGTVGMDDAVREVAKYVTKGTDIEKIPAAQLCAVERALRGRQMVRTYKLNAQRGRARDDHQAGGEKPYLDTKRITDGSNTLAEGAKVRVEPLRVVGARMIREGKRDLWLEMLRHTYAARREWRMGQLAMRYPAAKFRTLDGKVWGHTTA